MIRNDITGQTFGLLTVTGYAHGGKNSNWFCKCACGAEIKVPYPNLKSGNTTKCNAIEHRDGQNLHDITGEKFGRLTVVSIHQKARPRLEDGTQLRTEWSCICDCGTTCIVEAHNLKSGHTQSCGCYLIDQITTHGACTRNIRLYRIWRGMMARCYNENCKAYKWYGAKGISVCTDWQKVELFLDWALSHGYKNKLTLERIEVYGNYEPSNCEWIPLYKQAQNTTVSVGVDHVMEIRSLLNDGVTPKEVAELYGTAYSTIICIKNRVSYKDI